MSTVGKVITCKAAVVRKFNSEIQVESVKVAPPPPEHVRIKMVSCSLCHTDLSFSEGYNPNHPLPYVTGHEGAGVVESVGPNVTSVKPGDNVLTLCIPRCNNCPVCKGGRSTYCIDYKRKANPVIATLRTENLDGSYTFSSASTGETIYNSLGTSSFSQYTVIPENSCVKIHPNAPMEAMCMMACGFPTGFGAATNAVNIKAGETVAVWGMGGVGLACVLGCKDKRAGRIIGIDLTQEKKEIAMEMGCTDYIAVNSLEKDGLVKKVKAVNPLGVDFAFVCIGNPRVMEEAFNCLGLGGTLVVVGVTKNSDTFTVPPIAFLANKKIIGSLIGDYDIHRDIPVLVERYLKGELPIDRFYTKTLKLEDINQAVDMMKRGQGIRTVIKF